MTTPKRNEAVAPVAWAMTDYQADGAMTILTSNREQADFWGEHGIQIDNLYPASAIAALQGEVSRLRAASEADSAYLRHLISAISAFKGKRGAFMALGAQDARTVRLWELLNNLEPPTDGR